MDLYTVTGELVIQWGLFEASLNTIIAAVYHDFGGKTVNGEVEPIPVPFSRRMTFLMSCFNKLPVLAALSTDARDLRSKARGLSVVRDYIAHGHLMGFDPTTGVYTFGRLDTVPDKSVHLHTVYTATLIHLMEHGRQIGGGYLICPTD